MKRVRTKKKKNIWTTKTHHSSKALHLLREGITSMGSILNKLPGVLVGASTDTKSKTLARWIKVMAWERVLITLIFWRQVYEKKKNHT